MVGLHGNGRKPVGGLFDVHKHIILTAVLTLVKQHASRFHFVDTHAGAGLYDLTNEEADEASGADVGCLLEANKNEITQKYIDIVKSYNSASLITKYPGSPMIAQRFLRPADTMALIELDVDEYGELSGSFQSMSMVSVDHGSAFSRTMRVLPESDQDGVIFIDPDYLVEEDYADVANLVIQCRNLWPSAIILLTQPMRGANAKDRFLISLLKDSGIQGLVVSDFEFCGDQIGKEVGTQISRVLIVNARFELKETLESVLSQLATSLPFNVRAKSSVRTV